MATKLQMEAIEYEEMFGKIPDDRDDRVLYILGKKSDDPKFMARLRTMTQDILKIRKKKIKFTMWRVIRPSARPRANGKSGFIRMYVPHARENGEWFAEFAKANNLPVIDTPCELNMKIFEKTPSSFTRAQGVLAELGYIRPWKRTGDFDNYAKSIADAIQHGMLKDDCLIVKSTQELFYSIKPHAEVELIYMTKFPEV